jgi:Carboxypeptidase regulatory-like domain
MTSLITLLLVWSIQQAPASVDGVVIKMGSGEPIAGATVQLHAEKASEETVPDGTPPVMPPTYTATTTQDGRFSFTNVLPTTYRLIATKSGGYVPAEYGQRTPTSEGIPFEISAGQRMGGLQLSMASTGSIAGRVYDRDGEPLGKAQVQALRAVYKDGRRVLTIVQNVESNDRGEYRLFWLTPGRYYVSAKPDIPELPFKLPGMSKSAVVMIREPVRFGNYEQASNVVVTSRRLKTGEVVEETYRPVYYPGVVTSQEATPIPLEAGMTVTGIDVSVGSGAAQVHHIRGTVISSTNGQPVGNANVAAIPLIPEPLVGIASAQSAPNGTFDVSGLTPGSYAVFVSAVGSQVSRQFQADTLSATSMIEVGSNDIQNLAFIASPPSKLSGRFTIDGRSRSSEDPKLAQLGFVTFTRDPALLGAPLIGPYINGPARDDGTFTIDGVHPGTYRVAFRGLPPDSYIKSIRMGNADVLDGGLHIDGPPQNSLEIVIGAQGGRVSGTVVGARQEPLPNRTVVLVPDVRLRHRSDLYKTATTDGSGRFRLPGITPGDYVLFAWDNVETGAWQDPDFVRGYENRGKPIHIGEETDDDVRLTVIP